MSENSKRENSKGEFDSDDSEIERIDYTPNKNVVNIHKEDSPSPNSDSGAKINKSSTVKI